jgi:Ca-activated chloride channel family protein
MARRVRRGLLVLASVVSLGLSVHARQIFRTGTDMVLLSVTAADARNRPIANLKREDFQVLEDGFQQTIAVFSKDPQPIALSILIDSSTSMEGRMGVSTQAAIGFCQRLGPNDTAQVISFNSDVQILQPFTADVPALERAIHQVHASGSTSLYTALYIALNELNRVRLAQSPDDVRRQAIIVLSDGDDTTSLLSYDDVLDLTKRSSVSVYAIWLRDKTAGSGMLAGRSFSGAEYVLRSLSQTTGGRLFVVDDATELAAIYGQIADELANQYTIGYVSKNVARDGAWRQVAVRINQPGVAARTKAGYFGPKKDQ